MNKTIDYYNKHAKEYFENTSSVDFRMFYDKFLKHMPTDGRIMDIGCGSGRDVKWFRDHGYEAYGLDASEELVKIATEKFGIPVEIVNIEEWIADEPFDGIWCCASLMHLEDKSIKQFFSNLRNNLKQEGILFLSVKSGITPGTYDDGRYYKNYDEAELHSLLSSSPNLMLKELWYTEDKLSRSNFKWLNALVVKTEK